MPIARMVRLGEDGVPRLREAFRRLVRVLAAVLLGLAAWYAIADIRTWPAVLLVASLAVGVGEPLLWRAALTLLPLDAQQRFRQQLMDLEAAKARSRQMGRRRSLRRTSARAATPDQMRTLTDRPAVTRSRDRLHLRPSPWHGSRYCDPSEPWFVRGELSWDGKFLRATGDDGAAAAWRTRPAPNHPRETVVAEIAVFTNPSGGTVLGVYFLAEDGHRLATVPPTGLTRRLIGNLARHAGVRYRVYGLSWEHSAEKTAATLFPESIHHRQISGLYW